MSVTVDYKFALTTEETITGIAGATSSKIDYSQFEVSGRLNSTSTPPAAKVYYGTITATTSDSGTIDLTNLPGPLNSVIDATGLKLQALRVTSAAASAGIFDLQTGGTFGYTIPQIVVGPSETAMQLFNERLQNVGAGEGTLDWSCTGSIEIQITLIFG